mmetsp:Transcript_34079/g.84991  ORF Transcript_34079/g.84991 Transcript_34079/m.84991 type:complete len:293 (+) Transcript_34079:172-1050(+)
MRNAFGVNSSSTATSVGCDGRAHASAIETTAVPINSSGETSSASQISTRSICVVSATLSESISLQTGSLSSLTVRVRMLCVPSFRIMYGSDGLSKSMFTRLRAQALRMKIKPQYSTLPAFDVLPAATAGSCPSPPAAKELSSYLARMNASRSEAVDAALGFTPAARLASRLAFTRVLPLFTMALTCSTVQSSSLKLSTLLTCTPSLRCTPAHSRHSTTPRFDEAHTGGLPAVQSAQITLPGTRMITASLSATPELSVSSISPSPRGDGAAAVGASCGASSACPSILESKRTV